MVTKHILSCAVLVLATSFSFLPIKSSESVSSHAQAWSANLTQKLDPENLQLATNTLYLLYANGIIDSKIREFIIPITRLNQNIRNSITEYKEATEDLATLKVLLQRLSHLMSARTVYTQMLQTCISYYNQNSSPAFSQSIMELQVYCQNTLKDYSALLHSHMLAPLNSSAEKLAAGVQPLDNIAEFHKAVGNESLLHHLQRSEKTKDQAALIAIDELHKNNIAAIKNAEHILNILDSSSEFIAYIIAYTTDIYREHYSALYNSIMSKNIDPQYTHMLFGMADILPDEFQTELPDPDHVFEHVLHTLKLYTKTEITQ